MSIITDYFKISQITENIFLSGTFPLDEDQNIKKYNIKCILSCVDPLYTTELHDRIMINNPDITILYLPYNDVIEQNLWMENKNKIKIKKYINSMDAYNELANLNRLYDNKPMIEIGYHFIDNCIKSNNNILIHCMAGVSRSISVLIYYFMKKLHIGYDDALKIIKNKRIIANPNISFELQLKGYQNKRDKFTEMDANNIINELYKNV
ncbi:MAG: tyrosine-protein phosphatase [Satyrvirus sp.]|uniref:Tyrosine-protein phosphatase n=1 Tax=Satyrvirus sp. TaxID=2487771 RepID=A0A3G5ACI2_9VIRU|nr:MAG: tyrosine-protein phosphatase [Satyrvirus sp.]